MPESPVENLLWVLPGGDLQDLGDVLAESGECRAMLQDKDVAGELSEGLEATELGNGPKHTVVQLELI